MEISTERVKVSAVSRLTQENLEDYESDSLKGNSINEINV